MVTTRQGKFGKQLWKKIKKILPFSPEKEGSFDVEQFLKTVDGIGLPFVGAMLGDVLNRYLSVLPKNSLFVKNPFNVLQRPTSESGVLDLSALKRVVKINKITENQLLRGCKSAFDRSSKFIPGNWDLWGRTLAPFITTDEIIPLEDDSRTRLFLLNWCAIPGIVIYFQPAYAELEVETPPIRLVSCSSPGVNLAVLVQMLSDGLPLIRLSSGELSSKDVRFLPAWMGLAPVIQEEQLRSTNNNSKEPVLYMADLVRSNPDLGLDTGYNDRYFGERPYRFSAGPLNVGLTTIPLTHQATFWIEFVLSKVDPWDLSLGDLTKKTLEPIFKDPEKAKALKDSLTSIVFYSLRNESWLLNFLVYQLFGYKDRLTKVLQIRKDFPMNCGFVQIHGNLAFTATCGSAMRLTQRNGWECLPPIDDQCVHDLTYTRFGKRVSFYPADLRESNILHPSPDVLNAMFGPNASGYYGDFADISKRFTNRALSIQGTFSHLVPARFPYDPALDTLLKIFNRSIDHFNVVSIIIFCYAYYSALFRNN